MAEPHKVTVSPEALIEVVRAATWWREHRPVSPRLFQSELDQALVLIAEFPAIGTVARSKRVKSARVLQLTRSHYSVFYQVLSLTREVLVLHVRHRSRRSLNLGP